MTETEKSYIAGIIDGEGSIMLQKFHSNQYPSPCVSFASTSIELMNWAKKTIGSGIIISKKNYNPHLHKDCYSYVLKYNAAISLLEDITPYLIIDSKIKRANLILEKYKELTPRNGRYTNELIEKKILFYNEFLSVK